MRVGASCFGRLNPAPNTAPIPAASQTLRPISAMGVSRFIAASSAIIWNAWSTPSSNASPAVAPVRPLLNSLNAPEETCRSSFLIAASAIRSAPARVVAYNRLSWLNVRSSRLRVARDSVPPNLPPPIVDIPAVRIAVNAPAVTAVPNAFWCFSSCDMFAGSSP